MAAPSFAQRVPLSTRSALVRFLLVGGLAAAAYALIAAAMVSTLPGISPVVISAFVWVALIPPVYWCHRRFSFRDRAARRAGLFLYALTQAVSIAIVSAAGALFVTRDFLADTAIYLVASALAAVFSFVLNRWLVFAAGSPGQI